jgi:hypothetical protein
VRCNTDNKENKENWSSRIRFGGNKVRITKSFAFLLVFGSWTHFCSLGVVAFYYNFSNVLYAFAWLQSFHWLCKQYIRNEIFIEVRIWPANY